MVVIVIDESIKKCICPLCKNEVEPIQFEKKVALKD